jgi:hypothetical protein
LLTRLCAQEAFDKLDKGHKGVLNTNDLRWCDRSPYNSLRLSDLGALAALPTSSLGSDAGLEGLFAPAFASPAHSRSSSPLEELAAAPCSLEVPLDMSRPHIMRTDPGGELTDLPTPPA